MPDDCGCSEKTPDNVCVQDWSYVCERSFLRGSVPETYILPYMTVKGARRRCDMLRMVAQMQHFISKA